MLLEKITDPFAKVLGSQRGKLRIAYQTPLLHAPKMSFCDDGGYYNGCLHFTPQDEREFDNYEYMWVGDINSYGHSVGVKEWNENPARTLFTLPDVMGGVNGNMRTFNLFGTKEDGMQLIVGVDLKGLDGGSLISLCGKSGRSHLFTDDELLEGGMYGLWKRYREFCF